MNFKNAFIVSLVAISVALAAGSSTTVPTKPGAGLKPGIHLCKGTIVSLNKSSQTIILKGRKGQDTLVYTDSTRVMTAAKTNSIADLKTGAMIIVFYDITNNKKVATKIGEKMGK